MSLLTQFHCSRRGQRARVSRRATTASVIRRIPAIGTTDIYAARNLATSRFRTAWVGLLMAPGPAAVLLLPISLIGLGIGVCWAFILQRVMTGAKPSEGNIAAASVATVQQTGIAFGAAIAGLIANASGLGDGLNLGAVLRAAFFVPIAFVVVPFAASMIGLRLVALSSGREPSIAANRV
jgi:hypothetical protein